MGDGIQFFRQFIVDPRITGAVWPSSRGLARRMTEWLDWGAVKVVIEYGPGTGVFTEEILSRKSPQGKYLGIERNALFADILKKRFPTLSVYNDSVDRVRHLCDEEGLESADLIVCGLPWASFTSPEQDAFLRAMLTVLPIGGKFATFAYLQGLLLPSGRRFRATLRRTFARVDTMPPAFVYRCTR